MVGGTATGNSTTVISVHTPVTNSGDDNDRKVDDKTTDEDLHQRQRHNDVSLGHVRGQLNGHASTGDGEQERATETGPGRATYSGKSERDGVAAGNGLQRAASDQRSSLDNDTGPYGSEEQSSGALVTDSESNGRRNSRKTAVYILPSQSALKARDEMVDEEQEEQGTRNGYGRDDDDGSSVRQSRRSPQLPVKVIVTPAMNEPDSGVDTETGTPSPLAAPLPSTPSVEDTENGEHGSSCFAGQIHPMYEKKVGRKASQDTAPAGLKHLTGATRRISHHSRKVSLGSDGNNSTGTNVVPSRKGSMVLIDQIPQLINESLQRFLLSPDPDVIAEEDNDMNRGAGHDTDPSRRISVFSFLSRRDSRQSDVTFWDPHESLPHADHYRQAQDSYDGFRPRPTLYQLREEPESPTRAAPVVLGDDLEDDKDAEEGNVKGQKQKKTKVPEKKGWIQGVLVRCLLNIFGVMLFLRLTWITGQAGIGLACVIVLLSSLVTTLTTMSMAAICTNGEVRGGGAYYMISRSLGPEFGGAIGVIFSLANAVAAAMYVVGFSETLRDLIKTYGGAITGDDLHDVRVLGVAVTVLLLGVVLIGLDFETKAQIVLLIILVVSIINFVVGTFLPPAEEARRAGFVGYDGNCFGFLAEKVFLENLGPEFQETDGVDYDFFKVFAIFFPAATGILAGANISGDLKNPSTAIPRGTFLAILITTVVYVAIVFITGSCMLRDAVGEAVSIATNFTMTLDDIQRCGGGNGSVVCESGMLHTHELMRMASGFGPLLYAGVFSATLSSALASLVSAPKVFQALGKDQLFPFIGFFAKEYGKDGEPRRSYFLTFLICIAMTCIGSLDIIAPIISNFFLMAYALINFSCFDAAFANSPGFRPSYQLYSKWSSLVGALLCAVIMFMLSWWAALITVLVIGGLYIYIKYRKPDVNWGSSGQAHAYSDALKTTLKLVNVDEHVKNFRPQILVLTGYPRNRPALVDFAASITKRQSLLVCAHVFQGDMQRHLRHLRSTAAYRWFRNRGVRSFYTSLAAPTVRHGSQGLLQSQGLGKLRPNTLLLGFKNKWQLVDPRSVHNYVGVIHDAFDLHYGVGVLRVPGGLDTHKVIDALLDSTDDTLDDLENDSIDEDISEPDEENETSKTRKISTIFFEKPESPTYTAGDIVLQTFKQYSNSPPGQQSHTGEVNDAFSDDDLDDEDGDEDDDEGKPARSESVDDTDMKKKAKAEAGDGKENGGSKTKGGSNFGPDKSPTALKSVLSRVESTPDDSYAEYFRRKQEGTIDVWWLFDDGGLGLLLPHILSTRKLWKQCKMRVFCAGTKRSNLQADHGRMASLLSKFRIDYSEITVLPDLRKKPKRSSYKEFEELIYRWRLQAGETQDDYPWKVSNADLAAHKDKIYMQIKIREKLLENSKDASLVVVTLPVPRKFCPAGLYMAWLDTLTRDLPPTLLLRGNQQSVLTYFS